MIEKHVIRCVRFISIVKNSVVPLVPVDLILAPGNLAIRPTLNCSSDAEFVTWSGKMFHALMAVRKKRYFR